MALNSRMLLDAIARSLTVEMAGADVTGISSGHSTGWRTLPGCTTAEMVDITIQLERQGHPPLVVRPGQAFCLGPSVHHRATVITGSGLSRWSLFDCLILGSVPLMSLLELPVVLTGESARRLGDLNAAVGLTMRTPAPGLSSAVRQHAQSSALVAFLVEVAQLRSDASALLMYAERLAPVLSHLERHVASPVSRAGLAKVAGLSPSRFHALFRAAMGVSPLAYALNRRLSLASQLVLTTDLPIQEIAGRLGFADPFYFSRLFKSRMRLSPNSYRRRARQGLGLVLAEQPP